MVSLSSRLESNKEEDDASRIVRVVGWSHGVGVLRTAPPALRGAGFRCFRLGFQVKWMGGRLRGTTPGWAVGGPRIVDVVGPSHGVGVLRMCIAPG